MHKKLLDSDYDKAVFETLYISDSDIRNYYLNYLNEHYHANNDILQKLEIAINRMIEFYRSKSDRGRSVWFVNEDGTKTPLDTDTIEIPILSFNAHRISNHRSHVSKSFFDFQLEELSNIGKLLEYRKTMQTVESFLPKEILVQLEPFPQFIGFEVLLEREKAIEQANSRYKIDEVMAKAEKELSDSKLNEIIVEHQQNSNEIETWYLEYELRQVISLATRWKIEGILEGIKKAPHRPYGIFTLFVENCKENFEKFSTQLKRKLETIPPQNWKVVEIDLKQKFILGINQYIEWYEENKEKIAEFGQYNPYEMILNIVESTKDLIVNYFPELGKIKAPKPKKQALTSFKYHLTEQQVEKLFKALKPNFIDEQTSLEDFKAVFFGKEVKEPKVKWLPYEQKRPQATGSKDLVYLLTMLGKRNKLEGSINDNFRELGRFIKSRFLNRWGKPMNTTDSAKIKERSQTQNASMLDKMLESILG
jgi:hypothetical protein